MNTSTVKAAALTGENADVKHYAGLAMQAMIAAQGIPQSESAREEIALWSHRMAEAMVDTQHRLHALAHHNEVATSSSNTEI